MDSSNFRTRELTGLLLQQIQNGVTSISISILRYPCNDSMSKELQEALDDFVKKTNAITANHLKH